MVFASLTKPRDKFGPDSITREDLLLPQIPNFDANIEYGQLLEQKFGENFSSVIQLMGSMRDSISNILLRYMTLCLISIIFLVCVYFLFKYFKRSQISNFAQDRDNRHTGEGTHNRDTYLIQRSESL